MSQISICNTDKSDIKLPGGYIIPSPITNIDNGVWEEMLLIVFIHPVNGITNNVCTRNGILGKRCSNTSADINTSAIEFKKR
ncbi:hypothetical protein [Chitinophaga sp. 212800010-3]|uniref:hypothetical protein n=1 Tax=unclassified Chitinophaga TaxID=2619133 RepID=UPI002DEA2344|nr:hypothetical protein [Chitinophaga sp. 212800010-3]